MFALILLATYQIFLRTNQGWQRLSGDQSASSHLQRAEGWLRRDLSLAAYDRLRISSGPLSLSGKDGDAVWFLSAIDPDTGEFVRNGDGSPRWQRNILYYSVIPAGSGNADFQGAGIAVDGYEVSYPYKLLVRKEIQAQELIDDIGPYLERPNGLDFSSTNTQITLVASRLLSFQVNADDGLRGVRVTLQAASLEEAAREFPIGSRDLLDARFLLERRFELFPENRVSPTI